MSGRRLVVALLLAALGFCVPVVEADARPVVDWSICPSEQGEHARCVWDGRHMGDRRGPSFVTSGTRDRGVFVIRRERVSHKRAHRLVRRALCAEYGWRCPR